jgi:hypothetical protein
VPQTCETDVFFGYYFWLLTTSAYRSTGTREISLWEKVIYSEFPNTFFFVFVRKWPIVFCRELYGSNSRCFKFIF